MDLIDRAALLDDLGETHPMDYNAIAVRCTVVSQPAVEAVPLDKLCAKLAATQMSVRGEPMSLTLDADGWRMIILDWMEEET